ncbi:hypothetical protein VNI00_018827 [Paramarasmius palmivorus]|uniref:Uncharacterized protein n=1 Tax=Paramarasmius palmivorus TaxID=297713 RepID=A0AAW0AUL4_9AGAR
MASQTPVDVNAITIALTGLGLPAHQIQAIVSSLTGGTTHAPPPTQPTATHAPPSTQPSAAHVPLASQIPASSQQASSGGANASGIPFPPPANHHVPANIPGGSGSTCGATSAAAGFIPGAPAAGTGGGVAVAGGGGAAHSLLCPHCGANVVLPPTDSRWYAIFVGTRIGWVRGFAIAHQLTNGVSGNAWQHFNDEQSACAAFLARHGQDNVRVVGPIVGTNYPPVAPNNGWLYP